MVQQFCNFDKGRGRRRGAPLAGGRTAIADPLIRPRRERSVIWIEFHCHVRVTLKVRTDTHHCVFKRTAKHCACTRICAYYVKIRGMEFKHGQTRSQRFRAG